MGKEATAAEQRLQAAIRCEKTDRVCCAPMIESYASRFAEITNANFFHKKDMALDAFAKIKETYPIWDIRRSIYFIHYGEYQDKIGLLKCKLPGRELPDDYEYQVFEYEAMSREDYRIITQKGFRDYLRAFFLKSYGVEEPEIGEAVESAICLHRLEIEHAKQCEQAFLYGAHLYFPVSYLSNLRSFEQFIRDMYKAPELLCEAISIATDAVIEEGIEIVKRTGLPRAFVGVNRASSEFFSLPMFEKFVWPYLERMVLRLVEEGITPVLHLDGDWSKNLCYFQTLPKRKLILEFDGSTDIFAAYRALEAHTCILGDVSAARFVLGQPEDVYSYSMRLLKELGTGGGFILGSGCTLPHLAQHQNVAAFFQALSDFAE